MSWEERTIRYPPQPSPSSPNEGTIVEEPVTSVLNARSWQSGRINEGMTPKQCHAAHCNSQQVEGSAGWDRHSSGNLHNRQMDGQNERSRRIYITREISQRGGGTAIRKTPGNSIGGVSEKEKKNSSSDEARGRTLTLSSTTPLMILFPNDPARLLKKSSQRPSS